MRVYYFGCAGSSGHCLVGEGVRRLRSGEEVPAFFGGVSGRRLDTPFCPGMEGVSNGVTPRDQPEGVARVTHVEGWTVLAFWDRSVDGRRGSHSTFAMEGTHDFGAAVALARGAFPSVWARYTFEVRL